MSAIRVRRLVRRFAAAPGHGVTTALDGIDLDVDPGEVRGLLGPNGAGKTTLCKILSTILLPTEGRAEVLGHDVVTAAGRVKRSVGLVFGGDRGLYGRLTARQNLRFWAALYGLHGSALRRRADELLDRVGLTGRADDRVDVFSRGMKQRLHLARGLVADPPVLILDEPTVGMDPAAAHDFRELVGQLRSGRRTVLLTTHDMAEAEAVCDRVSLIDHGRLLLTDAPRAVSALTTRYERVEAYGVEAGLRAALHDVPDVVAVTPVEPDRVRVETATAEATRAVVTLLLDSGVTELSTGRPSLEEAYLHLVGARGMRVGP